MQKSNNKNYSVIAIEVIFKEGPEAVPILMDFEERFDLLEELDDGEKTSRVSDE